MNKIKLYKDKMNVLGNLNELMKKYSIPIKEFNAIFMKLGKMLGLSTLDYYIFVNPNLLIELPEIDTIISMKDVLAYMRKNITTKKDCMKVITYDKKE